MMYIANLDSVAFCVQAGWPGFSVCNEGIVLYDNTYEGTLVNT